MAGNQQKGKIFILFAITGIYWIFWSMLRPIVALYLNSYGLSAGTIGMILSLQTLLPFIFAMPIGKWIDRIGVRTAVLGGAAILTGSMFFFIMSDWLQWYAVSIAGLFIIGIGSLLTWGSLQAAATKMAIIDFPENKNKLISNFSFINSVTQFAGPSLGGVLLEHRGYGTTFVVLFGLVILILLLAPRLSREASPDQPGAPQPMGMWTNLWGSYKEGFMLIKQNHVFAISVLMSAILFGLIDLRATFFPIYLDEHGYSESRIGFLLSAGALATILVRPVTAYLLERLHLIGLCVGSIVIGGLCLASLLFQPGYAVLLVIVIFWAFATGINQPVSLIMSANSLRKDQQGLGASVRQMANRSVEFINPALFGMVAGMIGLSLSFALTGGLLAVFGAVFMLWDRSKRQKRGIEGDA